MEYKIVKLKEITDFNKESIGKNSNYDFINYLDTANITKGTVDTIVKMDIKEAPSRAKRIVHKDDIIYSTVRPNLYHYGIIDSPVENMIVSTGFTVISCKDGVNPYYVYNYLTQNNITSQLHSIAENSTSAYPSIKASDLESIEIKLPKLELQNKIDKILTGINKKIKLNNEINNNLYEMLEKLYNENYLNNVSYDGWKFLTMNDVTSKFATGLNPRKNFVLGHGNNYYVTIKNILNNQVVLDEKCDKVDDEALVKINKRADLKVGDLLFSGIGTIGRTYLIKKQPNNWNISESIFTIRPNEKISSEFLYLLLLSNDMQNYAITKASGSVQKGIRMTDLKSYKLKVPDKNWMNEFTSLISPIINKIYENFDENVKLEQLRDILLPKLMNGEIDLNKIKI